MALRILAIVTNISSFPNSRNLLGSQASCLLFTPTDSCWAVLWRHLSLSLGKMNREELRTPWSCLLHQLFYDSHTVGGAGLYEGEGKHSFVYSFLLKRNNSRILLSQSAASSTQSIGAFAKITKQTLESEKEYRNRFLISLIPLFWLFPPYFTLFSSTLLS